MKSFTVTFLSILGVLYATVANAEPGKTRAQQLASGEAFEDVTARTADSDNQHDERYFISPGPPKLYRSETWADLHIATSFLCQNGDPLHNASKWEYFEECLDTYTCEVAFGGYSVPGNWCGKPDDSSNECCVEALCAAPYDSTLYSCVDIDKWPYCNGIVGGPELCPGPHNVRCCLSD